MSILPLVEAKCPNCGANLSIDDSKEAAVCEYCGTPYVVEKAIQGAISNSTINNSVINVYNTNLNDKSRELSDEELYERYLAEFKALKKDIWRDKVKHAKRALILAGISLIAFIVGMCLPKNSVGNNLLPIFGGIMCPCCIILAAKILIVDSESDRKRKRKLNEAYENAHFKKMFK